MSRFLDLINGKPAASKVEVAPATPIQDSSIKAEKTKVVVEEPKKEVVKTSTISPDKK
jgi:hypothetical protein